MKGRPTSLNFSASAGGPPGGRARNARHLLRRRQSDRYAIAGDGAVKRVPQGEAVSRKFPESVVFIVAVDEAGTPNVMPAGWSMFTSGDPLMLAVSVGHPRHTHRLLEASEEFVVGFPSAAQKEDIEFCGSHTGAEVDKFAESGLERAPPAVVDVPLIEDAAACFECRKGPSMETGDHTIFAGKVVAGHVSERHPEKVSNLGRGFDEGVGRFRTVSELLDGDFDQPDGA